MYSVEPGFPDTFHGGKADSALSTAAGSGVWKASEAADRDALLLDWLTTYNTTIQKLSASATPLKFGAALPFWLDTYNGEPLSVTLPAGGAVKQPVWRVMVDLLRPGDSFQFMSCESALPLFFSLLFFLSGRCCKGWRRMPHPPLTCIPPVPLTTPRTQTPRTPTGCPAGWPQRWRMQTASRPASGPA